jgi:hypothetical protein
LSSNDVLESGSFILFLKSGMQHQQRQAIY